MGMLFQGSINTGRDSAFFSPESEDKIMTSANESFYEIGDAIVYQAMMDSMCAVYHGVCADAPEIIREGLGDMAKSAYEFFKNIVKKIVNFIKNTFNYLMSYIQDFDKFIDKYKDNQTKFKGFEVQGYNYTIEDKDVDNCGIEKIVNQYNSNVEKIKKMEMGEIQELISKEISKDEMGKLRGQISGAGGNIKADKLSDALMKKYRGGKTSKVTIKVNPSTIGDLISDFRKYKEMLKGVKEEGYKIESILNELADFFKGMPDYEYKDSDNKEVHTYKISTDRDKGDVKTEKSKTESYDTDYYKKLTAYYNFCFRMTKDIMAIYTRAYTTKVAALKEALSFCKENIRRALSPFADSSDDKKSAKESLEITQESSVENEDYSESVMDSWHEMDWNTYFEHFNQYINEVEVLGEAYHRGMIMMEDVEINDKDKSGQKDDRNIFEKIIDFIKKMINAFVDKAKNLFNNNKEWFEKNRHKFDELGSDAYAKLKITIVPYESRSANGDDYKIPTSKLKVTDPRLGQKGFQTLPELSKQMFDMCTKLSMSGDIVEGSKIYFRGGSNNLKKYEGAEVNNLVTIMLKYCENYVNVAVKIKDRIEAITKVMDDYQEKETAVAQKESLSYSIAENALIENTVFGLYPWIDSDGNPLFIAREAETQNSGTEQKKEGTPPQGEVSSTDKPETKDEKGKELSEGEKAKKKAESDKEKTAARARVEYWRVHLKVATALLTVAEERYVRYIKTLRDVLSAAKVTDKHEPEDKK